MPTEALLQEMLDEFALRKLVHAYCRAVDRGDLAKLRELYHHDAVDAHGGFSAGTVDDFLDELAAARPYIRSMQHNITTVNFAVDGTNAECEIYTIASQTVIARDRDVDSRGWRTLSGQVREARRRMEDRRADNCDRLGSCERSVVGRPEPPDHQGHAERKP